MKQLLAIVLLAITTPSWAWPVPGSMDVNWNAGAPDCAATPQPPLQVHAYEPQTFILRQNPCADFEANFIYLLIGSDRALLIDTGAVAEPGRMPLAERVLELLRRPDGSVLPLVVAHTHGHLDHRAGDSQFASLPSVRMVPTDPEGVKAFFGFETWPDGDTVHFDLGGRAVDVMPAPGHHPSHVVFHDERTALLFSGDFLLPGRLLVKDTDAYRASAARVAAFLADKPLAHVLGGHIELDTHGQPYPHGTQYHPDERRLQLDKQDLMALPAAFDDFNGFYARHGNFILVHPIHNLLTLAAAAVIVLVLVGWGLTRFLRRRRAARQRQATPQHSIA